MEGGGGVWREGREGGGECGREVGGCGGRGSEGGRRCVEKKGDTYFFVELFLDFHLLHFFFEPSLRRNRLNRPLVRVGVCV